MREPSYPVNTEILQKLHDAHGSRAVAARLKITPQRFYMYKSGRNDMPDSLIKKLCRTFRLARREVVRRS